MKAVVSRTWAMAASTSARIRAYCALRSTIGTVLGMFDSPPRMDYRGRFPAASGPRKRAMLSAAPAFDKPRTDAADARERPLRVCMFVTNSVSIDTRVIKEAASLSSAGHTVTVLGLTDP